MHHKNRGFTAVEAAALMAIVLVLLVTASPWLTDFYRTANQEETHEPVGVAGLYSDGGMMPMNGSDAPEE